MSWPSVDRWRALIHSAGAVKEGSEWHRRLTDAYGEPQRFYHNRLHIEECMAEFDTAKNLAADPIAVEFALWFHDAVYQPRAADNEEQSAALAQQALFELGVSDDLSSMVRTHIMVTKTHSNASNPDSALVLDIDLSILGRQPGRFFEYESQIQKEYAWVSSETFAQKRAEILESFLARPRIFATEQFYRKFEEQARLNLAASIAKLRGAYS